MPYPPEFMLFLTPEAIDDIQVIFYRLKEQGIQVVRLLHSSCDIEKRF